MHFDTSNVFVRFFWYLRPLACVVPWERTSKPILIGRRVGSVAPYCYVINSVTNLVAVTDI